MNLFRLKAFVLKRVSTLSLLTLSATLMLTLSANAETLAPPTLGEKTKGTPAIPEVSVEPTLDSGTAPEATETAIENESVFGTATVTEHKRESGQVYLIEFDHSLGGKQYLYENDSDGKIGSSAESDDGISEIPKWKLGSW